MRQIKPVTLEGLKPAKITTAMPVYKVLPLDVLRVDECYQRELNQKSLHLIKKIVNEWSWNAFKPLIVARDGAFYDIIDGQHTAVAAATHGGIPALPAMVVEANTQIEQADSFARQNRDRIRVSPLQLHFADLAAGKDDALLVQEVCEAAGVVVLRYAPHASKGFEAGQTISVQAIDALIKRITAREAIRVLSVCARARCKPVSALYIRAVERLLFDPEYRGQFSEDKLVKILTNHGAVLEDEASRFAAEHRTTNWRALASVINMRSHRRRA